MRVHIKKAKLHKHKRSKNHRSKYRVNHNRVSLARAHMFRSTRPVAPALQAARERRERAVLRRAHNLQPNRSNFMPPGVRSNVNQR
jgi:hypothetical protein